jgi:predicted RNase H-like HicB family nuclease
MHRYVVVFEKAPGNWAAYSPDAPGCVATGATKEETAQSMREALGFHLEGLREKGLPIPEGSAGGHVEVEVLEVT